MTGRRFADEFDEIRDLRDFSVDRFKVIQAVRGRGDGLLRDIGLVGFPAIDAAGSHEQQERDEKAHVA